MLRARDGAGRTRTSAPPAPSSDSPASSSSSTAPRATRVSAGAAGEGGTCPSPRPRQRRRRRPSDGDDAGTGAARRGGARGSMWPCASPPGRRTRHGAPGSMTRPPEAEVGRRSTCAPSVPSPSPAATDTRATADAAPAPAPVGSPIAMADTSLGPAACAVQRTPARASAAAPKGEAATAMPARGMSGGDMESVLPPGPGTVPRAEGEKTEDEEVEEEVTPTAGRPATLGARGHASSTAASWAAEAGRTARSTLPATGPPVAPKRGPGLAPAWDRSGSDGLASGARGVHPPLRSGLKGEADSGYGTTSSTWSSAREPGGVARWAPRPAGELRRGGVRRPRRGSGDRPENRPDRLDPRRAVPTEK